MLSICRTHIAFSHGAEGARSKVQRVARAFGVAVKMPLPSERKRTFDSSSLFSTSIREKYHTFRPFPAI